MILSIFFHTNRTQNEVFLWISVQQHYEWKKTDRVCALRCMHCMLTHLPMISCCLWGVLGRRRGGGRRKIKMNERKKCLRKCGRDTRSKKQSNRRLVPHPPFCSYPFSLARAVSIKYNDAIANCEEETKATVAVTLLSSLLSVFGLLEIHWDDSRLALVRVYAYLVHATLARYCTSVEIPIRRFV